MVLKKPVISENKIHKFEKSLSLPNSFFHNLLKEDDWSFIVKLSSLFEAACTQLLAKAINADALIEPLSHLEMGNYQYGKIKLLSSLKLINADADSFIRKLSEVRNDFVHNISMTHLSLKDYIEKMNVSKRNDYAKALSCYMDESFTAHGKKYSKIEFFKDFPAGAIWLNAYACLSEVLLKKEELHIDNLLNDYILSQHA